MHHEAFMCVLHGGADVQEQRDALTRVQLPRVGPCGQGVAIDEFQCEPRPAFVIHAVVEQGRDVGVRQRGQDAPLLQEALRVRAAIPAPLQALDRGALRGVVLAMRHVHRAGAAAAQPRLQLPCA